MFAAAIASFLVTLSTAAPSSGTEIRSMQSNLRKIGWPITVDGKYGSGTRAAVRAFQEGWTFKKLAVDGDAGPSTLPEISQCASSGGKVSKNFLFAEFKSKGNGDIRVKRALVFGLEKLRSRVGKPLRIISAYRDPAHNKKVRGASHSQHLSGSAADIPYGYATPALVRSLQVFGGIGIACKKYVTHVDVRAGSTVSPVSWPYPC